MQRSMLFMFLKKCFEIQTEDMYHDIVSVVYDRNVARFSGKSRIVTQI